MLLAAMAVLATVNGDPVTAREFERQAVQLRALVFDEFQRDYRVEDGPSFWETLYNGRRPRDVLSARALAACVRIKVQQALARREGLAPDISYETFLGKWERENARRREAVRKGEPVYGPVEYGEDEYFAHTLRLLAESLRRRLALSETDYEDLISTQAREAGVKVAPKELSRVRLR